MKHVRVIVFLNLLAVVAPLYASVYWTDTVHHLQFTLYPETREAMLGNGIDSYCNACAFPGLEDSAWDTRAYLHWWDNVIVPDTILYQGNVYTVTSVGANAFNENTYVLHVTLPESVVSIGSSAFRYCVNLESVNLPKHLKAIEANTFTLCRKLTDITVPSTVEYIAAGAFSDCSGLTKINIPAACLSIGQEAFRWCRNLSVLNMEDGDEPLNLSYNYSLGIEWEMYQYKLTGPFARGLFADCPVTNAHLGRKLIVPSYLGKVLPPFKNYVCIGYDSRTGKQLLSQVGTIWQHVSMGKAFTEIPDEMFYDCTFKDSLSMPENLKFIGASAFYEADFENQFSLTLPPTCDTIATYAFGKTEGLYQINIQSPLPPALGGSEVFWSNTRSMVIGIPSGQASLYKADSNWKYCIIYDMSEEPVTVNVKKEGTLSSRILAQDIQLEDVHSLKVKGTLNETDWNTIHSMTQLISLDMSGISNTVIPSSGLSSMTIQNVVLPANLSEIGDKAFNGTSLVGHLTIPSGCHYIGSSAFSHVLLNEVSFETDSVFIDKYAFSGCQGLKELRLPGKGTTLASEAFTYCKKLKRVSAAGKLRSVGAEAFRSCYALEEVSFADGLDVIGASAFDYCEALKEISLPSRMTSIGNCAFQYCMSLDSISIPDGVDTIGSSTFYKCISLKSVRLPDSLVYIGQSAFYMDSLLSEISLPQTLRTIDNGAFVYCGLKEVDIPLSCTGIASWPFAGTVEKVYVHWDTPVSFNKHDGLQGCLYVPIGTSGFYLESNWGSFKHIKEYGTLTMSVGEGGCAIACSKEFTHGTKQQTVMFSPYKSFTVELLPDSLHRLKNVLLNGVDVKDEVEDGLLLIEEPEENISLQVIFDDLFHRGDVDDDGEIGPGDFVGIVNFIMEKDTEGLMRPAADANCDGRIDAGDGVAVVNYMLYDDFSVAPSGAPSLVPQASSTNLQGVVNDNLTLDFSLGNPWQNLTAVQFDLVLPEGLEVSSMTWKMRGAEGTPFHVYGGMLSSENRYRVLGISVTNQLIDPEDGLTIRVSLKKTTSQESFDVVVDNIRLVKTDTEVLEEPSWTMQVVAGEVTGLEQVAGEGEAEPVYDVSGYRADPVKGKIMIVKGNKYRY